ncbi:MAG: anti-sigma factor family protein [Opitutales bacterium]
MRDEAFQDLVNLHLDGELSSEQRNLLRGELEAHPQRAREFSKACKLNVAMQMVLDPCVLQPKDLETRSRLVPFFCLSCLVVAVLICSAGLHLFRAANGTRDVVDWQLVEREGGSVDLQHFQLIRHDLEKERIRQASELRWLNRVVAADPSISRVEPNQVPVLVTRDDLMLHNAALQRLSFTHDATRAPRQGIETSLPLPGNRSKRSGQPYGFKASLAGYK